ncbi:STM3941 family protein [Polaribacter sp. Z022]|uniref:STM3941 family protein n=1 Tax=Polaribacter sp. Z022 TaxID=2927125 RepID=UPI00201FBEC1|nr:STM3941 family protein [Polaribacter sp. Z022]MCL7755144.1 hypothetical protein [Polaribacter sp. Z022]
MTEIKIPLSKTKIILLMIGALAFVVGGIFGIIDAERFASIRYPKNLVFYSGLASVLFFGLCFVFIAKKVFSRKSGLTINENGIIDHSNATSIGLIEWNDITGIETIQIDVPVYGTFWNTKSPKMLIIKTSSPEKYIKRSKNIISKKVMEANNRMYGTPLTIISNTLKIKFSELEEMITEQLKQRKNKNVLQQRV